MFVRYTFYVVDLVLTGFSNTAKKTVVIKAKILLKIVGKY